ncbi:hypothetical protein [Blastococcus saxobsidens]|nr:hypothetical protein [Blastococcus saxobsidens]
MGIVTGRARDAGHRGATGEIVAELLRGPGVSPLAVGFGPS